MKPLITLALLCLFTYSHAQVNKEATLLGKKEVDILAQMRSDNNYHYLSLNKETDTSYHLTYESKTDQGFCNFYIERDSCTAVVFYFNPEKLPALIINLNKYYKRTAKTTWIDNDMAYMVNLFLEDNNVVKIGFKKL